MITQERFDKVKKILQRECKDLSGHEFTLLDNFLHEVRRNLVEKPVETTNEQRCKIPHKGRDWCSVYKGICKCHSHPSAKKKKKR